MRSIFSSVKSRIKNSFFLSYTLIFCLMALACYLYFLIGRRAIINAGDATVQHYKALVYYAQWLRAIARDLLGGSPSFPTFSFSFGLGADLFTTLQYYVIGDPFTLLSVFVPVRFMPYFYTLLFLLRQYCVGIAFSLYARYMKKELRPTLAGAVVYAFCAWMLTASTWHPYFANPLIFFPLLLLGVEKLRRENRPWVLIFSVAVSAMSNFYFFYMLVLFVVCYVVLETLVPWDKNDFLNRLKTAFCIAGYSVLGLCVGAALFLPILTAFFSDSRAAHSNLASKTWDLFYNVSYYEQLPDSLIASFSPGSYTILGVSAVTLLALFLLFKKKGRARLRLKAALCVSIAAFLLPLAGKIANGFSYVANRWSWGVVFLFAFILTDMWPELLNLSRKELIYLGACLFIYFAVCSVTFYSATEEFYFCFSVAALALFWLAVFRPEADGSHLKYRKISELVLFAFLMIGIGGFSFYLFSPYGSNEIDHFRTYAINDLAYNTEASAVKKVSDPEEFSRYSGTSLVLNSNVLTHSRNTQFYWSLSNRSVNELYNDTLVSVTNLQTVSGFDSRAALEELSSVKYFVTDAPNDPRIPYGYQPTEGSEGSRYCVSENEYALPLGYTYSTWLTESQAAELTPLQRQQAMLQAALLQDDTAAAEAPELSFSIAEPDFEIACDTNDIHLEEGRIVTTAPNQTFTLTLAGAPHCETYLYFDDLHFTGTREYDLYNDDSSIDPLNRFGKKEWNELSRTAKKEKLSAAIRYAEPTGFNIRAEASHADEISWANSFPYETPKNNWYNNRKDFLANLYYSEAPVTSIKVTLPQRGVYTYGKMGVLCQTFEHYREQTDALKANVLENVDLHENAAAATNRVTASITLQEPKVLVLSIPYASTWTAYVNGEKAPLFRANSAFMALKLEAGSHEIELRYRTAGLSAGLCISAAGLLVTAGIALYRRKRKKQAGPGQTI